MNIKKYLLLVFIVFAFIQGNRIIFAQGVDNVDSGDIAPSIYQQGTDYCLDGVCIPVNYVPKGNVLDTPEDMTWFKVHSSGPNPDCVPHSPSECVTSDSLDKTGNCSQDVACGPIDAAAVPRGGVKQSLATWSRYKIADCKVEEGLFSVDKLIYAKLDPVCSNADKCVEGEKGLRPGYCTCGEYGASLYKYCCSGIEEKSCTIASVQDTFNPKEGVCSPGSISSSKPCNQSSNLYCDTRKCDYGTLEDLKIASPLVPNLLANKTLISGITKEECSSQCTPKYYCSTGALQCSQTNEKYGETGLKICGDNLQSFKTNQTTNTCYSSLGGCNEECKKVVPTCGQVGQPACPPGAGGTGGGTGLSILLEANPTEVAKNSSTNISWSTTNAKSCTATNFSLSGKSIASDNVSVSVKEDTTFTLACEGTSGDKSSKSVSVKIVPRSYSYCEIQRDGSEVDYSCRSSEQLLKKTFFSENECKSYLDSQLSISYSGRCYPNYNGSKDDSCVPNCPPITPPTIENYWCVNTTDSCAGGVGIACPAGKTCYTSFYQCNVNKATNCSGGGCVGSSCDKTGGDLILNFKAVSPVSKCVPQQVKSGTGYTPNYNVTLNWSPVFPSTNYCVTRDGYPASKNPRMVNQSVPICRATSSNWSLVSSQKFAIVAPKQTTIFSMACDATYKCEWDETYVTTEGKNVVVKTKIMSDGGHTLSGTASLGVRVVSEPKILSFSANPSQVLYVDQDKVLSYRKYSKLNWSSWADTFGTWTSLKCSPSIISGDFTDNRWVGGINSLGNASSKDVSPLKTTVYGLKCSNIDSSDSNCFIESAQSSAEVKVMAPDIKEQKPGSALYFMNQIFNISQGKEINFVANFYQALGRLGGNR